MADDRKAMDPKDIIGKWAVVGLKGAYVTKDPAKYGMWTMFSAEALLFNTKAEAEAECCGTYYAEQVVGLRSPRANDISENLHG